MTTTNGVQNAPITSKPSGFSVLDLCLIAMFAALLAICSWISIPAPPPLPVFTMQTFGVFVTLELLGGKRGFFSILTFVLLGAVGVQMGTRFLTAKECNVHANYKAKVIAAKDSRQLFYNK